MILIFFGKTLSQVLSPYSKELSCKKSKKSLELFLRKTGNQPTTRYGTCFDEVAGPTSKLEVDPLRGRKNIKSGSMIVKLDRLTNSQKDRFILSLKLKKMAKKSVFYTY